jgi:hypothetical protein
MQEKETMGFRRRWEFTAPESYALLHGPKREHGMEVFRFALAELVVSKKISCFEGERRGLFGKRTTLLTLGEDRRRPESRSLAALLDLVHSAGLGMPPHGSITGIPFEKLVRMARKRYGWAGGYAEAEVMPALVDRGLYMRRERAIPVSFAGARWEPTAIGRRAIEELEAGISSGYQRFERWVDEDPEQAIMFLALTGSAVLLMRTLHRDIRRLGERRKLASDSLAHAPVEADQPGYYDLSASGASLYPDLEMLDSLNEVFTALDLSLSGGNGGEHGGG